MEIVYNFDKEHIRDNEIIYLNILEGVVASVDNNSCLVVNKSQNNYLFRISPSEIKFINSIIEQINNLNNSLQIVITYGKSFKKTSNIFFTLSI